MNKAVVEKVVNKVIEMMDNGIIPWKKSWVNGMNLAVSHNNGKPYSFLNQMLLEGEAGEYATFNQIKKLGGHVKKGAKSKFIVFWSPLKVKETNKNGEEIEKTVPYLVYYNVFNINKDVEGIEPKYKMETKENKEIKNISDIIQNYIKREGIGYDDVIGNCQAYYSPKFDKIVMPNIKQFDSSEEFYSTLAHESIHSTGIESRMNRYNDSKPAMFGSEEYGLEELVAECGSSLLCSNCGIDTENTVKNSVAYIQNWKNAILANKEMVITAFSKAEKAVDFILNGKKEN